MSRAVYPGTFDPFTAGHLDVVDRGRRLFDHVTVLLATNDDKRPVKPAPVRAAEIRAALPAGWSNVEVDLWTGLTATYCHRHGRPNSVDMVGGRRAGCRGDRNRAAAVADRVIPEAADWLDELVADYRAPAR